MHKGIQAYRYSVFAIITIAALVLMASCVHWYWLWLNHEPDRIFLVATEDVVFDAGDNKVKLPKGIVLYPVDECETNDKCYPGGQYKVYVCLENDALGFDVVGWPNGMTNVVDQLKR